MKCGQYLKNREEKPIKKQSHIRNTDYVQECLQNNRIPKGHDTKNKRTSERNIQN